MNPKIEILMATYNGEKYIEEQIDSIINQTYKNWILLVRDDNSKDNTVSIIEEYEKKDSRIRLLRDKKGNLGFVRNFEELMANSLEDFIMFSDQDDYWIENRIEKYIEIITNLSSEDMEKPLLIHSNSFICDKELNIKKEKFISNCAEDKEFDIVFFNYIVQGSTALVNRKLVNLALPFSSKVTLHDRYLHLLAEFLGKRIFLNQSLMKYRQHDNNKIGANYSIVKKILKKKYFNNEDRELILEIRNKYIENINKEKIMKIDDYLEVTDISKPKLSRLYKSFNFKMNKKKRMFLLFK
ncbi:glycosyltransferase family 2 protein [Leptotrichia hongkongensis]|uniref:glycosyltransferase family 2 protein n=1 Tax=Leptotrichia hongkongensis TaxID=554406 RepID=UPI0035A8AE7D